MKRRDFAALGLAGLGLPVVAQDSFIGMQSEAFLEALWKLDPDAAVAAGRFEFAGRITLPSAAHRQRRRVFLKHWLARFEASVDRIAEMFDERFVRIWRLYLASSAAAFLVGNMQLFQVVFAPAANNDAPRTRAHLYNGEQQALPHDDGKWEEAFSDQQLAVSDQRSAVSGQPTDRARRPSAEV